MIEVKFINVTLDSAGGAKVILNFRNLSDKVIKYAYFTLEPYNRVEDTVECTISHESSSRIKYTGPLDPDCSTGNMLWESVWYNYSIVKVKITSAEIIYMDGSEEKIAGNELNISESGTGCYVATCVYGSYDCPQVWTLRRYRDYSLSSTWYGRTFIRLYYAVSPAAVRSFGNRKWFRAFFRKRLDRMTARLQRKGFSAEPYKDRKC
ncbi:MAG: hypothetical protein IJ874_08110 [Ruminococcus sp.]|nr:hypothetical protein [Ruminococcus sp.]